MKSKHTLKRIGGISIFLSCIAIFGIMWIGNGFRKSLLPNKSVDRYQEVLKDWKASGLVRHFPRSVPSTASNVKFSSFPGFAQGGGHIQLRMVLPEAEVRRLYEHATMTSLQYQDGGNSVTLVNKRDDGLSSTSPHTLAEGTYEFPNDYRIFIFHAKPYKKGSGHDWNHGTSKGMVISLQRNEVLYYAESW